MGAKPEVFRRTCNPKSSERGLLAGSETQGGTATHEENVDTQIGTTSSLEEDAKRGEGDGKAGKEIRSVRDSDWSPGDGTCMI